MRKIVLLQAAVLLLLNGPVFAQEGAKRTYGSPITITSETLMSSGRTEMAVFEGSVTASNDSMKLTADKMTVKYEKSGEIESILTEGNVVLHIDGKTVGASRALYTAKDDKLVFTGGPPRVVEDKNVITGESITYYMAQERYVVKNSRVWLKGK